MVSQSLLVCELKDLRMVMDICTADRYQIFCINKSLKRRYFNSLIEKELCLFRSHYLYLFTQQANQIIQARFGLNRHMKQTAFVIVSSSYLHSRYNICERGY